MPTRRVVLALSGTALTTMAMQSLTGAPPHRYSPRQGKEQITPAVLSWVDALVSEAQQADDQEGSARRALVAPHVEVVTTLLRTSEYDEASGRHLARALAQLNQTLGFMAFEDRDDRAAQRHYLMALRAAHAARDRSLAASILGLMSTQAADSGYPVDALQLASAARQAATEAPASVRALIAARSGLAYAAAGDLTGFESSREHVLALREEPPIGAAPSWASYVDPVELDAIAGRSLVVLSGRAAIRQAPLLTRSRLLLAARASTPVTGEHQRSALRHGAWLSLAHARAGELDAAVEEAQTALQRLPAVRSARSLEILRQLATTLAPHGHRSVAVHQVVQRITGHLQTPG
ncbi:hypothetical protein [Streptacidiphilus sp. EB103A]|uniref:hypothetical protein n=1 Tax=Streptacidiphilus sp. EB103A TaxID=3156275 RepID=UPI00351184A4